MLRRHKRRVVAFDPAAIGRPDEGNATMAFDGSSSVTGGICMVSVCRRWDRTEPSNNSHQGIFVG